MWHEHSTLMKVIDQCSNNWNCLQEYFVNLDEISFYSQNQNLIYWYKEKRNFLKCSWSLLKFYIRVRTFSFAEDQMQSHKIKQSILKSRSLRTSLTNGDFEKWRVTNHQNSYFHTYKYWENKNGNFFCFSFVLVSIIIWRKKDILFLMCLLSIHYFLRKESF